MTARQALERLYAVTINTRKGKVVLKPTLLALAVRTAFR